MNDFTFTVSPEAAASIHDEGIVILHTGNGGVYTGNQMGARIWRGLEQKLPLESIAEEISKNYQIARTTAHEDAIRFVARLAQLKLVQQEAKS